VPASIAEVIARARRVVTQLDYGRLHLRQGYELVGEALDMVMAALEGSVQWEAAELLAQIAEIRSGIETTLAVLDTAQRDVHTVIERLGVLASPPEPAGPTLTPQSGNTPPITKGEPDDPPKIPRDRIEALRDELPPPVQPGKGQKTHGRWIGPDGRARSIVSGRDEDAALVDRELQARGMPGKAARTSDVEMKLAARMARHGIKHATVIINNYPCKGDFGCDTLVPVLLPEGCTLTVHGVYPSGTRYYKRFTGGATPWWH